MHLNVLASCPLALASPYHQSKILQCTPSRDSGWTEIEVPEGGLQAGTANKEMLELLVAYLPKHFPDRFVHTEENHFLNLATGDDFDLDDPELDPLEVSALLVQVSSCSGTQDSTFPPITLFLEPRLPIALQSLFTCTSPFKVISGTQSELLTECYAMFRRQPMAHQSKSQTNIAIACIAFFGGVPSAEPRRSCSPCRCYKV